MKTSITTLLMLFLSINLCGQFSSIYGQAIFEKKALPVDSLKINLIDSLDNVVKSVITDKKGIYKFNDLKSGMYKLYITKNEIRTHVVTGIVLDELEDLEIDLEISDPCENQYKTKKCPYCKSVKKILKISPGFILDYNFGGNISAANKYDRKIRKKGYETYVNSEGEKIVISMFIESEHEKFWDLCHNWFCKKCKRVF